MKFIYLILVASSLLFSSISNNFEVTLLQYTNETIVITALSIETEKDAILLTRIAQGEAIGEGSLGMQLVMECVLNRAESSKWPSTIEQVIKQKSQFNGYNTKNYNAELDKNMYETAVKLITKTANHIYPKTMYYFYNPDIATNKRFINNIRSKFKINKQGRHEYAY